jgi:hypothetical protein
MIRDNLSYHPITIAIARELLASGCAQPATRHFAAIFGSWTEILHREPLPLPQLCDTLVPKSLHLPQHQATISLQLIEVSVNKDTQRKSLEPARASTRSRPIAGMELYEGTIAVRRAW